MAAADGVGAVVPHVNVLAKWDARASRNLLTKLDP